MPAVLHIFTSFLGALPFSSARIERLSLYRTRKRLLSEFQELVQLAVPAQAPTDVQECEDALRQTGQSQARLQQLMGDAQQFFRPAAPAYERALGTFAELDRATRALAGHPQASAESRERALAAFGYASRATRAGLESACARMHQLTEQP